MFENSFITKFYNNVIEIIERRHVKLKIVIYNEKFIEKLLTLRKNVNSNIRRFFTSNRT